MEDGFIPVGDSVTVKAIRANDLRVGDRLLSTAWLYVHTIAYLDYLLPDRGRPGRYRYGIEGEVPMILRDLSHDDVVGVTVPQPN